MKESDSLEVKREEPPVWVILLTGISFACFILTIFAMFLTFMGWIDLSRLRNLVILLILTVLSLPAAKLVSK